MNKLLLLTILILPASIFAQGVYNSKSLVVSMADLKNTSYPKDTTANAFYIYEKGYSRVQNGGNYDLLTDYEAKLKILNKQGIDQATIEIFLYRNKWGKEKLNKLVAHTYNLENGKIVKTKINESLIFKEVINENYTSVKFTFPNIKPGSVLSYKYQTESPFMYKFNGWTFQEDIPKIYSEFTADLPGNYDYNIRLIGTLKLNTNETTLKKNCIEIEGYASADCSHSVYTMKDIPAFHEEKYMTAKRNYLSRIEYELKEYKRFDGLITKYTETWKNVENELKKEPTIGVQLKKTGLVKDLLPKKILSISTPVDKARAIYKYVANTYKWNGKNQIFLLNDESQVRKVIENKTGNVSGINILLHNLLKQQGFDVHPVLLSTRRNGYATTLHPIITDFNYLIVQLSLNEKKYLLDATENKLAFGEIPFRCLNQKGRLLDFKKGSSWIDITPAKRSSYFFKEKLILNRDNKLTGEGSYVFSGYHAYNKRQGNNIGDKDQLQNNNPDLIIHEIIFKNAENTEKPFEQTLKFSRSTEEIEDLIYIKPFTRPFFTENPFKLNERTYPVDFGYKDSYINTVSLEIPDGYSFVDVPKNKKYLLPNKLGIVSITITQQDNKILLNHRIIIGSAYYPTEYYDTLKEFFNLIVQIENDTFITVKKIS